MSRGKRVAAYEVEMCVCVRACVRACVSVREREREREIFAKQEGWVGGVRGRDVSRPRRSS
jgi:hypothetical protein